MDFSVETECIEFDSDSNSHDDAHLTETHERFQPIAMLLPLFDLKAGETMSEL